MLRKPTVLTILSSLVFFGCKSTAKTSRGHNQSETAYSKASPLNPSEAQRPSSKEERSKDKSPFDSILQVLQKRTNVPLRLPAYLATEQETYPLYAIVETATPSKYEVQLAFTPRCTGGNVCHYGYVSGQLISLREGHPSGKEVSLAKETTGYFIDATCGAVCSDSTLTWDQDGYRYTVGLKAEKLETLKKVADSAM